MALSLFCLRLPLPVLPSPLSDGRRSRMSTLDLQVIRFLGEGTGGKVYLVKDQLSRARIALKVVAKQGKNDHALSVVLKERRIAEKLSDSPWFVELWAAWGDQRNFYIAMVSSVPLLLTYSDAHRQAYLSNRLGQRDAQMRDDRTQIGRAHV